MTDGHGQFDETESGDSEAGEFRLTQDIDRPAVGPFAGVVVNRPIDQVLTYRVPARLARIIQVGHVERFNPAVKALRDRNFKPRFLEAVRVSPFPYATRLGPFVASSVEMLFLLGGLEALDAHLLELVAPILGALLVVVAGPDELSDGQVTVRDMRSKQEDRVALADLTEYVRRALER